MLSNCMQPIGVRGESSMCSFSSLAGSGYPFAEHLVHVPGAGGPCAKPYHPWCDLLILSCTGSFGRKQRMRKTKLFCMLCQKLRGFGGDRSHPVNTVKSTMRGGDLIRRTGKKPCCSWAASDFDLWEVP